MKILQTVKYYHPSKGGMESVVQNIVEGITAVSKQIEFIVFSNNHFASFKKIVEKNKNIQSIKEATPLLFKSQPLNFRYPSLKNLITEADIVHHHYPFPNMELALLKNKEILKKKKLIITWHANIENSRWSFIEKFYNPLIRQLLDLSAYIVVTSPQLLENSSILNNYKERVKVIPLSFDPEISLLSKPRGFPSQRNFRLLFVGKLREYKGVKYLIEAIKSLPVTLSIVGEGENEPKLKDQVKTLGMESKVVFLKELSNEELKKVYQDADLFVLPSINEAEAFGVVQLEALANGLPVINTNLKSGVPYVSLNGITGFTIQPESSEELRNAIQRIINDKDLYETFSENSLVRIKEFSRDALAESYLRLYQS